MSDNETIELNPKNLCETCANAWIKEYHKPLDPDEFFSGKQMYCKANAGVMMCITFSVKSCTEFELKKQ